MIPNEANVTKYKETLVISKMSTEDVYGFDPFTPSFWRDLAAIGKLLSGDPWIRGWSPVSTELKNKPCQQPYWVSAKEDMLPAEPSYKDPAMLYLLWEILCHSYPTKYTWFPGPPQNCKVQNAIALSFWVLKQFVQ